MLSNFSFHEVDDGQEHVHEGVHDLGYDDTHEFIHNYESFDTRLFFMMAPSFLFLVIAWLAFDWKACVVFYYHYWTMENNGYHTLEEPVHVNSITKKIKVTRV